MDNKGQRLAGCVWQAVLLGVRRTRFGHKRLLPSLNRTGWGYDVKKFQRSCRGIIKKT
jgi:hypothetical protein